MREVSGLLSKAGRVLGTGQGLCPHPWTGTTTSHPRRRTATGELRALSEEQGDGKGGDPVGGSPYWQCQHKWGAPCRQRRS